MRISYRQRRNVTHSVRNRPCIQLVLFLSTGLIPQPPKATKLWPSPVLFSPPLAMIWGWFGQELLSLLSGKSQHIWSPAVVSIAQLSAAKMQSSESCCPMEIRRTIFIWISSLYLCVDFTSHSQRQRVSLQSSHWDVSGFITSMRKIFHRKTSSLPVTNLNFC